MRMWVSEIVFVAIWGAAGSGVACAGPIQWSYSSTGSEGQFDEVYLRMVVTQSHAVESAFGVPTYIYPVTDWTWTTNRTNLFGSVGPVNVKVTVVDGASGATGEFFAPYFGSFDYNDYEDRKVLVADPSFSTNLVLGGNTYAFTGGGGGGALGVTISQTALTPEPATAVMAGLGLAALALVRRRRKAAAGICPCAS